MRVFVDASAAAKPRPTGVGHYVARLCRALLEAEPSLSLVLGVRRGGHRSAAHLPVPPGARIRRFWSPLAGWAASGADVVHGPDARLVGGRAPQVVTIHDLFNLTSDAYADHGFRREKIARYRDTAARAARVICPSDATARGVREHLGVAAERIVVAPLGVDGAFRPMTEAEAAPVLRRHGVRPPYVLFVGLAQPRKNIEAIVRVFGRLAARNDDLSLVLAGEDGYPTGRLPALLKETNAVERVRLLGYVPHDDLPALYAAAGCLLFPSRDEGFGLPALEAMASGCPVVASTAGALPEVLGPGALAFPVDAIDDLEDATARMIEDPEARAAEITRGTARAQEFPWRRTAEATIQAYRSASASR